MFAKIPLCVAMGGIRAEDPETGVGARSVLEWVSRSGARGVRLDATAKEIRPRELDRSARRDLASLLGRLGLRFAGVDCYLPPEHYADAVHVERAMGATLSAIELCAEFAGLCGTRSGRTVSVAMRPEDREAIAVVRARAEHAGIRVGLSGDVTAVSDVLDQTIGLCLDPARSIAAGRDVGRDAMAAGGGLVCARLTDTDGFARVRPGAGRLDLSGYAAALLGAGYREEIVLDLRGVQDQRGAIEAAITAWEGTGLGTR